MRIFRRFGSTTVICVLALSVATPASAAPKGPWEPAGDNPPQVIQACGTTLIIDEEVQRERIRVTETDTGATIEIRGFLSISVVAADGRSVTVNASGPITITASATGNVIELRGRNFITPANPIQAAAFTAAGLPLVSLTSGPATFQEVVDPETGELLSASILRVPPVVTDVCTLLS